jgi:cell division topological specificity factor
LLDFFNRLFNPAPPSGATAKERLRLVLLSDHLSLAPDVVEALKRDLLHVISRYVEIDQAHADVTFEHREGEVAMLASIPITGVRPRRRDEPPEPPASAQPAVPPLEAALTTAAAHAPLEARAVPTEPAVKAAAPGSPPRRRRRRKASAAKRAAQAAVQLGTPAQA